MPRASILVVDDEESVAVTMGAILEMDGYQVETVTRGADALQRLGQQTFDLVLTDLRLDDMDGLTIIAEAAQRSPGTLAIMLTGYASLDTAVKALRQGAYDYLIKPCDVEELRATVARAVERRRLGQELSARVEDLERANGTIRSLNADLQRRVDEATAALRERMEELARAKDEIESLYRAAEEHVTQLRQLDELKSRFLSMASHELKTPLTTISGLCQLVVRRMQRRLGQSETIAAHTEQEHRTDLRQLEIVLEQVGRLARLVDELLDVSRIESGRVDFRQDPVDLAALAQHVVANLQLTGEEHPVSLGVEPLDDVRPVVQGDRDHLEQVLSNLLSNAIKYSPAGAPVRVSIRCDARASEVVLRVQDTGPGIAPEHLTHVFDLFYRVPGSASQKVRGMGLGLYITKEIVTRHSGRIWAESEPGRGSTFTVVLPLAPAAVPEPIPAR